MQTQSFHITINEDQPKTELHTLVFCLSTHVQQKGVVGVGGQISAPKRPLKKSPTHQNISLQLSYLKGPPVRKGWLLTQVNTFLVHLLHLLTSYCLMLED